MGAVVSGAAVGAELSALAIGAIACACTNEAAAALGDVSKVSVVVTEGEGSCSGVGDRCKAAVSVVADIGLDGSAAAVVSS